MSGPRLSIIPAGAVTDRTLKRGDLQVLCLLGRHIDRAGWCVRSQVKMAIELGCGRASVQRSLDRLVAAGWVEMKSRNDGDPSRQNGSFAYSYAYRVRLDQDEVAATVRPAENALEGGGCPPVGIPPASVDNPAFPQGGMPSKAGKTLQKPLRRRVSIPCPGPNIQQNGALRGPDEGKPGIGCPGRNGQHNDSLERLKNKRLAEGVDNSGGREGQPGPDGLTKPPNGSQGRGMVWWDHGTPEWQLYADDYFEHRGVKKNPEQRIGGTGNWFVRLGEPENGNH